ncbi:MAG: response regulator [Armatimonadetes bacterium]|nr:response regulator [Armatimonadota bacterium]
MKRVLIADDESVIRMDLRETLEEAGYEVVAEASDGAQALELARRERPDVAVLDIKMPRLDGIQAAEAITKERVCPVLMLTAYNEPQAVARAADAGVMAFLSKPYHERDLIAGLEVAKARFDQMVALEQEVDKLEDTLQSRKLVDRAKALLMERHGMTEPEAFRAIQKTAMNQRRTMRQVAEAVIMAAEIGGERR